MIIHKKKFLVLDKIIKNKGIYINEMFNKSKSDLTSVHRIIDNFEDLGLIVKKKDGVKRRLFITPKGKKIHTHLKIVYEVFNK